MNISLFCCLCYSCSSIEQTSESELERYGIEKTRLTLASSKGESKTVSIVPRYVFEDKDKAGLLIQEDTISPKYHLMMNSQNQKACTDIINLAYYNNFDVELKYDAQSLEVSSIRLNITKRRTKAEDPFVIPTGEIDVDKTSMEPNDSLTCFAHCCGMESTCNNFLISVMPFASYFNLSCSAKNYEYARKILEAAEKRQLSVVLKFICETKDILKIKVLPASELTKRKLASSHISELLSNGCSILTEEQLKDAFRRICLYSCRNKTHPLNHPCIPFDYAEDGCFARAHAMRRILNEMGYECMKLFFYDNLNPKINGECYNWKYHVAILLKVHTNNHEIKEVIIDPSLCPDQPVSEQEWTDLCYSIDCPKGKGNPIKFGKEKCAGNTFGPYSEGNDSGYISDYPNYLMTDFVCKYVGTPHWSERLSQLVYNKVHNIPFNEEEYK